MRKGIVACVGMIVGLVLLIVSFLGPWYLVNADGVLGGQYSMELFLTRLDFQGNFGDQDLSMSVDYETAKTRMQSTDVNIESFATIETAMYMMVFAMVTAVVSSVCMAVFVFSKVKPTMMKLLGGLFAILTFLLTIVPAVYFMNSEFVEDSSGFWFRYSAFGMTLAGGPGYAWYLVIVVAIIAVICAAAILIKKITPEVTVEQVVPPTSNMDESVGLNNRNE